MKKAKHGIEAKLQTVEQPFAEELLDHELEYVTGGTTHSQHNQHNRGGELEDCVQKKDSGAEPQKATAQTARRGFTVAQAICLGR